MQKYACGVQITVTNVNLYFVMIVLSPVGLKLVTVSCVGSLFVGSLYCSYILQRLLLSMQWLYAYVLWRLCNYMLQLWR